MSNDSSSEIKLAGDATLPEQATLLDFWRWAFSDQCDDDIKGIFADIPRRAGTRKGRSF